MEVFDPFLANIDDEQHRERTKEVLAWIAKNYPNLKQEIRWNQPMFTDHDTFIIAFSVSKKHLAVSPELACMEHLAADIEQSGYSYSKQLVRVGWNEVVNYKLLAKVINFNIADKMDCETFWRKEK